MKKQEYYIRLLEGIHNEGGTVATLNDKHKLYVLLQAVKRGYPVWLDFGVILSLAIFVDTRVREYKQLKKQAKLLNDNTTFQNNVLNDLGYLRTRKIAQDMYMGGFDEKSRLILAIRDGVFNACPGKNARAILYKNYCPANGVVSTPTSKHATIPADATAPPAFPYQNLLTGVVGVVGVLAGVLLGRWLK